MAKQLLKWFFSRLYRVEVRGLEHYEKAGKRVLIVANHLSFLDALLLALYLPQQPLFAINMQMAKRWFVRPFLWLAKTFPLDPASPMAVKGMIREIRQDRHCVIFPEGRITVTGSLMKVYEGPGMIADKSGAQVLPVRIDGAQYSPFSRIKAKVRTRCFPAITLTLLEPRRFQVDPKIKGRERRKLAGVQLYDLMSEMLFDSADKDKTLYQSLLDQVHLHGRRHVIAEEASRQKINYGQLLTRSSVLGDALSRQTQKGEFVGILLPNALSTVVTFFALQAYGRVPAMLNFSTGAHSLCSSCQTAQLRRVITARKFIEAANLQHLVDALQAQAIRVEYLEEIAASITRWDKFKGLVASLLPACCSLPGLTGAVEDPAVVLFTSGSEGAPKGVVLSHRNIQANRFQLAARVDFGPTDIVFNVLPMFHSFGLTGGTLLPLLSGIRTFFYPSPLHYRIVPELVYDSNATILFGTDTFLSGYARFANPYDFYSIRYVFAGAEKLKESTRKEWTEKYGVRIFEGYGATETAPALSTNTPMHNKPGTVGRLLPGIQYQLQPVPGIEQGARLLVSGPNIMRGYLLPQQPGVLVPPEKGFYDTGDIVQMDEDGFVRLLGRAKRFAKVAGEMISLSAVEGYVADLWPDHQHAVLAVADRKKGEALVLVSDYPDANSSSLQGYFKAQGIASLALPKTIEVRAQLPLLGTGKIDYRTLQASVD